MSDSLDTKQRLLIYLDLLLSDPAEAAKFRDVNNHDERFIALVEIHDKLIIEEIDS